MLEFREDGRTEEQIRRIEIEHGKLNNNGYIMYRQGNSCVRAVCNGPREGNRILFHVRFSKTARQEPISEKRLYDYEDVLQKIFSEIILAENQLDIDIDVIQEDGSLVSAMVNCIYMCLCYSSVPLLDSICSVTLSENFVDLSSSEEGGRNAAVVLVYLINKKQFLYVRSAGRISKDRLEKLLERGTVATEEIFSTLKTYLLNISAIKKD
ncbi:Exosome complex component RRP41 [Nosema granulosis]|uniref:Exosome complex component RRP41 n=1 Tax=Nosema granulosis TaxID=83296 RepID=A0A9P6GXW4_9MICR|nr:Exosome complex component RRP41 [Nosema granulosis]